MMTESTVDGCPLHCAAQILKRHGLKADKHYDLSRMGVKKKPHEDFDPQETARALNQIVQDCKLADDSPSPQSPSTAKTKATSTSRPSEPTLLVTADFPSATDEDGLPEPSSPVCYLREFKDW